MKLQIFKSIAPLLLILAFVMPLSASNPSFKGKTEFTRKIEREFEISSSGKVGLSNKHGKVEVKTWDKNSVEIEVTIIVNAKNESAAEGVFERIHIDFDNGRDYVKAMTSIESKSSSWWTSSSKGKSDYEINYLVRMPQSNELQLANKYGHSFVEDIDGSVVAEIKYGDLNMARIGGELDLQLGYGNAVISRSGDASIDMKYGSLRLKETNNVDINSKYSNVFFTEAGNIRCGSKYDNYKMGTVGRFKGEGKYDNFEFEAAEAVEIYSKYTNVKIGTLSDAAKLELEYGGAQINMLEAGFSTVDLKGKHSGFKVKVDDSANYRIDLSANYGSIEYPRGVEAISEKRHSHTHNFEGYKGSENSNSVIKMRTSYGNCKVY